MSDRFSTAEEEGLWMVQEKGEGGDVHIPQDICPHSLHKRVAFDVGEVLVRSVDPCVGEHDV